MAISYPLNTPTTIGFAHQGQRWEASVNIPPVRRDLAASWKGFLTALKGQTGTFLLGDPDYATPRGDVSSVTLSGSAGDETVTVTMTGSLLAGDYIQLGSGATARLHQVLVDKTGNGDLEIWPKLRSDYTDATVVFNSPKGVFRLSSNQTSWQIESNSSYGISFSAVENLV